MTKVVRVGNVYIGGEHPVAIQSMTTADTVDTQAVLAQIRALAAAGCEIVRVAAYNLTAAENIRNIKDESPLPIVADVHFDYRIALTAIEAGADKVRINPGNIGDKHKVRMVADAARAHGIPIRVGANTGSLHKEFAGLPTAQALVQSAQYNIRMLEEAGFEDIVVSLKASNVPATVAAYRAMAAQCSFPLHLGVTEAGLYDASVVKSSIALGALLLDGIGDTLRVSITGDVLQEVRVAKDILRYTGLRGFGPEVIACPTCARTRVDVAKLASRVTELIADVKKPLKIAVMGCAVNGPGEARAADVGVACGDGEGLLFMHGQPLKKVPEQDMLAALMHLVHTLDTEEA